MEEVSHCGRTIVFISHTMSAISRLCPRTIFLQDGHIKLDGPSSEAIAAYLAMAGSAEAERCWHQFHPGASNGKIRLNAVRVLGPDGVINAELDVRLPCQFEIEYEIQRALTDARVCLSLVSSDGTVVFHSADIHDSVGSSPVRHPGLYVSRCQLPGNFLNYGRYFLTVSADIPFVEVLFYEAHVVTFYVHRTGGPTAKYPEPWPGVICPILSWRTEQLELSSTRGATRP
jgi:lipopolysaccharide transport system ATP-binding protein